MSYNISFSNNMSNYYYISGQGGTATSYAPAGVSVPAGSAIGTLPSSGNLTYTLSGYTYTIYVIGWYLESSLTTQVTTSWVPTADATLYAKWKMTANVEISASITVPKFATSVSWTCYSNGGSRTALDRTGASNNIGIAMAAPGANRNSDSYTWTGAVGGKALTLAAQSLTLNGVTRSVSTPGAGGSWSISKAVFTDILSGTSGALSAGSKTFSSGNYKAVVAWPSISSGHSGYFTISYYYAGSIKTSVSTKYKITVSSADSEKRSYTVETRTNTGTFSSGTYGAAGAYANASYHTSSLSRATVAAASGSGYERHVYVNA